MTGLTNDLMCPRSEEAMVEVDPSGDEMNGRI